MRRPPDQSEAAPIGGLRRIRPGICFGRPSRPPRGQHGADDHEPEPERHPDGEPLVQNDHAEHGGDSRVDVRDDRRADRPDLRDECREDQEGCGRADDPQDRNCHDRIARGRRGRPVERSERHVDQRGQCQRQAHDADRRQTVEPPREDCRTDGVAHGHHAQLHERRDVARFEVGTDDCGHAGHPDQQAGEPGACHSVGTPSGQSHDVADERRRGDQQRGERAGDVLFRRSEHHPRDRDLDHREGGQPTPTGEDRSKVDTQERDGQQDRHGDRRPGEHERSGTDLGDGDPDQQVGDAPDHRHEPEEHETAARHRPMVARGWEVRMQAYHRAA